MKFIYLFLFLCLPFYLFAQTFTGTYTIGGANPHYPTINAAVMALKAGAVIGPVDFSIRPGTYNEQVTISPIIGTSAVNTVTFHSSTGKPEDVIVTSSKSGSTNHYTWQLNATRYIIIKDITVANTSSASASGIHITSDVNTTAEFNTVQNCIIQMDAASTDNNLLGITISGLTINSTGTDNYCNYNVISGNRIKGGSSGIQIFSSFFSYKSDNQILNNLVEDTYHFGIETRTSINTTIAGNRIRMRKVSETRNEAFGMYLYYDLNSLYYNNMIEGGFANTTNGAGIYLYYPLNNTRLYFNSVYYESMSPYGRAFSYQGWQNCEIFNNIFYNAGTGYAFYSTDNIYQDVCLSDYNDLYSNGNFLAYWNGNHTTLQSFQTASLKDSNSISVEPGYFAADDLHTYNPFLDGKGTSKLEASTDIDGDTRDAAAPDMGADEFIPWNIDLALIDVSVVGIPAVKDSNFVKVTLRNEGKNSLKDKEFSLSYSDDEGLSWSDPETVKPAGLLSPYTTEDYTFKTPWKITKPGMVTLRVRMNPPGLTGDGNARNDTASTAICVGLGGTYTIGGTASDFSTISEAVALLSCGGVSSPVILNIAPGIYPEKISIGEIQGASDINRIIIRSATGKASDVTIITEGAALTKDHHVIQLNGADYVTLEKLTIVNTSIGDYVSGVHLTNGADYNTITGCVIRLDTVHDINRYRLCIVISSPADIFGAGNNANYTLIANNLLQGGSYGMRLCGGSEHTRGNRVINNKIINAGFIGIRTYLDDLDEVSGNTISMSLNSPIISYGIYLGYVNSDFKLDHNYISNPGFLGIFVDYSAPLNTGWISNNMISGKFTDTTEMARGIYLNNCSFITVAFNSISVDRGNSSAFNLAGTSSSDIMIYNNIFHNSANGYAYKIEVTGAVTASDHNDFYSDSVLAYWDQDIPSLGDLQTISSMEQHSLSVPPGFFAANDLHLKNPFLNGKGMYLAAVPADIDGDARNTSAPDIGADEFGLDPLPDATLVQLLSPLNNDVVTDTASVSIRIKNSGPLTLTGLIVRYTVDNADTTAETFGSSLLPGMQADHVFNTVFSQLAAGTYNLCAEVFVPNDSNKADNKKCITVNYVKTGTGSPAEAAGTIQIYPNPATQSFFIQTQRTTSGNLSLSLFDLSGKLCFENEAELQAGITVLEIPVSQLPAGIYVLQIRDKHSLETRKVIIRN